MIRRDYLMRQFEDFARVLARLMLLRREKVLDTFEEEINSSVSRFTQLELAAVEKLGSETYFSSLLNLDDDKLRMLADLLFEKMHYYRMKGDETNCLQLRDKCLSAYELLKNRNPATFNVDVHYRLQYLGTF